MLAQLENSAALKPYALAAPAAGAEWTDTVPAGLVYKFETLFFTLVTSAVVNNRFPRLQFKDAAGNIIWEADQTGQPASGTYRQSYGRLLTTLTNAGSGVTSILSIPDVWLPAGYIFGTFTANRDVGDQFSAVNGIVRVSSADYL